MDYLYSELNKDIVDNPYGIYLSFTSQTKPTSITSITNKNSLDENFDTDGQVISFTTTNPQYESFAYPIPYGKLSSIIRNGVEDISDWDDPLTVTKDDTIYYLYNTTSALTDTGSNITFLV